MSESKSQKTKAIKPKAPDWLLDNITEASKNARKIYLLYIGGELDNSQNELAAACRPSCAHKIKKRIRLPEFSGR